MNVSYSVIAAILLCATVRGETPAPATGSTLDAARRDLKTLPATERSQELLGKNSGLGSASLPALTLPGSGDAPPSKPEPNAPPSPTWLQDALNQTDSVRGQRRVVSEPALSPRDKVNGLKPASTPDPFSQYLGQWLTPRDQELLRPDARKATDLAGAGGSKMPPDASATPMSLAGAERSGSPKLQTLQTGFLPVSTLEPVKNPYLPEPAPQVQPPSPFAPAASVNALPGSVLFGQKSRPAGLGPGTLKPPARPTEAAPLPPTAPTLDDRKYFPQLRRF